MTPDERYDAWRDAELLRLKRENTRLQVELEAVKRVLTGTAVKPDADWHGMPFPRARARRRA